MVNAHYGVVPLETIPAEVILEKIAKGEPVEYDKIVVEGDIDIRKIYIRKSDNNLIDSAICITNSIIDGLVNFEGAEFINDSNFNGTCFKNIADFSKTKFKKNAYFGTTKFNDNGYFTGSIFGGRVHFWQSQFKQDASFIECIFSNYADFRSAIFLKNVNFAASTFGGLADFKGAVFGSYTNFGRAKFCEDLIFSESKFNGDLDFINSKCKKTIHIVKNIFKGETNFNDSIFEEKVIIKETKFFGNVSLERDHFFRNVNLEECFFKKGLSFLNLSFDNEFNIKNIEFNTIQVSWEILRKNLKCDAVVYRKFIRNFLILEQFKDADNCYYDYKEWGRKQKKIGYSKLADWLSRLSYGYGVRPFRPLYIGVILIGIFAIVYWKFNGISDSQVTGIYIQDPLLRAAYYSALTFIANAKSIPWNEPFEWLGLVETFVGWLLMALFLVTLSRTRLH